MDFIADRFRGQCALVVGGAQGIGKGIAVRLAREGASVMIGDIDRDMMARTEREITAEGGSVRTFACDVRRKREVQRMVAQTLRWQKRIDVLMYVAGVGRLVPFTKTDEKHWDWIVDINLKGAYLVAREVAPHMVRRRKGKVGFMG